MRASSLISAAAIAMMVTAAVTAPSWGQNPAVRPLNAKVQETLMGSANSGRVVAMSEDGDHLGIVTAKGSRQVMLIDGVEGPVFDEIPSIILGVQVAIQFSPTGGHSAYVGRRGGDFIAVVDGKEAGTLFTTQSQQSVGYGSAAGWKFWFSNDGSRLAYAAIADAGGWVMVVDGARSPGYRLIDFRQTMLNGKRLIYVAQTADQQWHLVADGKPGPGYGGISQLKLTPDGAHYAFVAQSVGSPNPVAVVDGVVEGQALFGVHFLEQAPDGRVAYQASIRPAPNDRSGLAALIVGGRALPGSCGTVSPGNCQSFNNPQSAGFDVGYRGSHVAFSPDGKGFAYIESNRPTRPDVTVMVNGKAMGPTYQQATDLTWSPDGSRFAYRGQSPTGSFLVLDGEELPNYGQITEFQWSPDGKRYSFIGSGQGFQVIVDGKPQPKALGYSKDSFRWSPDSKHFAYGSQVSVSNYAPVVDGETKPVFLEEFFAMNPGQQRITFVPFLFSSDGSHLAYVARKYDATRRATGRAAVVVDGVSYEGPMESYTCPSFSPDGKHFATVITTGQGWVVMIDGKVSPSYENLHLTRVTACRFLDNDTYRFYGIKGGQIYRVTLAL